MVTKEQVDGIAIDYIADMLGLTSAEQVPQELKDKVRRINELIKKAKPYSYEDDYPYDVNCLRSSQTIAMIVDEWNGNK